MMDLASALSMEGPLEKQSPNIIKVYQTRYFAIRGKGQFIVWFKKKPVNPDQDPKGILKIDTITEIVEGDQEGRYFSIVYLQRTFNFRAQSVQVKQRWVKSLQTILAHHQKQNKNKVKQNGNTSESWKWKNNTNQQISEQIRLQNEEVILTDASSQTAQKSEQFLAMVTKDKSLFDVQKCILYGFYLKKKLVSGSLRWYFLASGVNLKDQKDQQLYPSTQQLLQQLKSPQSEPSSQQVQKKQQNSSDQQQQQGQINKIEQNIKELKINCLFQYDPQTKSIKYCYNVLDMISFELKTNEQPFELKIVYEEITHQNKDDDEIKENQIVLMSNFLSQVKKLHTGLKIISEKYNMQKQREEKNANKSRRYAAKKWRYVNEDQWRVAEEKASLYALLNKKALRINTLSIPLQSITSHSKQSLKAPSSSTSQQPSQLQKKQQALYITFKKQQQQNKIYIILDKLQTLNKLNKKLGRNIKKLREQIEAENAAKIVNRKEEQKKVNQDTYLIDKKIRETHSTIKVNFYQLMDRDVVVEKKEDIQQKGFFDRFIGMFCGMPAALEAMANGNTKQTK